MRKKRTSLVLDQVTREKIRQYQLKHNKSMGETIRMGIGLLLKADEKTTIKREVVHTERNPFEYKILNVLEKYIHRSMAQSILKTVCVNNNISQDNINPRTISPEIILSISRMVSSLSGKEQAEIESKLMRTIKK